MAASDPLEKLFSSEVDENEISALVGSLKSQLDSPTIKDSSGQNSTHSTPPNHVEGVRVATPVSSHSSHTTTKAGLLQNNLEISGNASNRSNNHAHHNQILHTNSISTHALTQSSINSAVQALSNVNSSPLSTSNITSSPNSPANVKFTSVPNSSINSTLGSQHGVTLNNQVLVTVGSTNTGTVVLGSTHTNTNTVTLNSTIPHPQGVLPNHNSVANSVGQSGSSVQGTTSAIHSLASVAAAQPPLTIPNTNLTQGPNGNAPRIITVQQNDSRPCTPASVSTSNVPRPKVVMQSKPPEIKMVAHTQPQTMLPSSQQQTLNVSSMKVPNVNPANTNVITLANKVANPQTVTVVRPNATTQPGVSPQQVQIVNRVLSQPGTVATQPKVLAPRTVSTPIRIAPQQITRPQQIQLGPGVTLPQGTMLMKNERGQIVIVSNQQQGSQSTQIAGQAPRPVAGHQIASTPVQQQPGVTLRPAVSTVPMQVRPGGVVQQTVSVAGSPMVGQVRQQQIVSQQARPGAPVRPVSSHQPAGLRQSAVTTTTMSPHVSKHQVTTPHHQSFVQRHQLRNQMPPPHSVGHTGAGPSPPLRYPASESSLPLHGSNQSQMRDGVHHVPYTTVNQPHGSMLHRLASTNDSSMPLTKTLGTPTTTIPGQSVQIPPANDPMWENVKKCKNFLSTLIKLASNQPPQTVRNVKQLIQGLVDGKIDPEAFTQKLQVELKSSPQPYLVPFLRKSLPMLRLALVRNQMKIDGVIAPPREVVQGIPAAATPRPALASVRPQAPGGKVVQRPLTPGQVVQRQITPVRKHVPGAGKPGVPSTAVSADAKQQAPQREKRKFESLKDDDDINDVATMGGVNLTEESRNILATNSELMSGQLRSIKDETFLCTQPLVSRINAIARSHGLEDVPQEVATLISHATQDRLRNILEKLATIAEHRLEIYKSDVRYETTAEVRGQLRFLEELDKLEKKRHEEVEREVLLRAAKSRSKHEDPEQLKLKEKAKAMQQAEMEMMRHQEANMTALAAIGPRKKRKIEDTTQASSSAVASGSGTSSSTGRPSLLRPRIKRVNLRDILFLLEQEKETRKSFLIYKAHLK